ncbi:Phosphatidylinositol 3,4,5-trisphosphate 3-phosphatase and protein-tyrosine-phosphatase PTEN2B [Vitis vinifera]|uniref:Phosphatidylinositol 3,4,5-trisphosphate 3-phosphatase and protein-tyrosine-phosphatase PTEN2B n=1 Tax=Vitis vinifera TaxID=29760 RepID=A0A438FNB2_VITVI|nr:Phosphatidylinositol 3,4,5-trisphosphate 3-phosphatase and protein-tyrosine-phosphatase PTEN2B [Vitis vinifera]
MGFPAGDMSSGFLGYVEGFYRNHMEEVIKFFETHHKNYPYDWLSKCAAWRHGQHPEVWVSMESPKGSTMEDSSGIKKQPKKMLGAGYLLSCSVIGQPSNPEGAPQSSQSIAWSTI